MRKTVNLKIAIFFSLTRPGGVKIWPKEVNSGTIGLGTSQGFVWSLSHSSISIRGEMAWGGCNPPMCVLGWGNSMCGRGLIQYSQSSVIELVEPQQFLNIVSYSPTLSPCWRRTLNSSLGIVNLFGSRWRLSDPLHCESCHYLFANFYFQVAHLTLASRERYLIPPPHLTPNGFLAIALEPFVIESWNFASCLTPTFKPDIDNFFHFQVRSGQVTDMSQVNLRTVTKCRKIATLPMTDNLSHEDEIWEVNKPPGTYAHFVYLGFFMQVTYKMSDLTHYL